MGRLVSTPNPGHWSGPGGQEPAIHALYRDETGLLKYKKVLIGGNESININNGEGFAYASIDALESALDGAGGNANESQWGVDESGREQHQTNSGTRAYEQMVLDRDKITFYLNSNGELVARHIQNYAYAAAQDGATENWIG